MLRGQARAYGVHSGSLLRGQARAYGIHSGSLLRVGAGLPALPWCGLQRLLRLSYA